MVSDVPADIQQARQQINKIKDKIYAQQAKIQRLNSFITSRLAEESRRKLAELEKVAKRNFSPATELMMAAAADRAVYYKIQKSLFLELERLYLSRKLVRKLREMNHHYVWEIAVFPWEYWRKALSSSDADEIKTALKNYNLTLGVDYITILFNADPDNK